MKIFNPSSGGGGGGGMQTISVCYRSSITENIANQANHYLNFNEEDHDIGGGGTKLVTNPSTAWKFTVPAGGDGLYLISCLNNIDVPASVVMGNYYMSCFKNADTINTGDEVILGSPHRNHQTASSSPFGGMQGMMINGVVQLTAGETIKFQCLQITGAARARRNVPRECYASITRVGLLA